MKKLGIDNAMEDREILERELTQEGWTLQHNRRKNQQLKPAEIRAIIQGDSREARVAGWSKDETTTR